MFRDTLGEACARCGWRVHAFVLMGNHYHLLLETPEANLVAGMQWLQETYTKRFNVRHKEWGHLSPTEEIKESTRKRRRAESKNIIRNELSQTSNSGEST